MDEAWMWAFGPMIVGLGGVEDPGRDALSWGELWSGKGPPTIALVEIKLFSSIMRGACRQIRWARG